MKTRTRTVRMKVVRRLVLRMIARRRMSPLEVHGVLCQVGCECCVRSVYNVLRRLEEREGLAVSERVKTGRAGNRRREYWAVERSVA